MKNKSSYEQLTSSLENFTAVSGLKVNSEKTEFFCLGLKKLESFPHEFKTSLKILGVYFSYNQLLRKTLYIKKTLNMWNWRGLTTLLGKIQIVKSFAIPKCMSKAALIYVVNKELYVFIWNGKDKAKRSAMI